MTENSTVAAEMGKPSARDYHARIYGLYVSTEMQHLRDLSTAGLEKSLGEWRHYFGGLLPKDKSAPILEVGCGHGSFLYFLKAMGYRNVEGVDASPEQVATARSLGLDNVTCGDVMNIIQERPAHYDCVVGIDFLEHFLKQDVFDLLDGLYQSLRPGGRLVLRTPNGGAPFGALQRYWDFTHEFALTSNSARQLLEVVGFTGVRVMEAGPFVHGVRSFLRVLLWKAIKLGLISYLTAETGNMHGHILTQNLIVAASKPAYAVRAGAIRDT
jgi:2-polyprenyl-3-methyl-5-hydroxy-6-metoxy-1,4-benzoquinol methylase